MKNQKVLVIVSGGIACYKAASLVSTLSKENTVKVIMTKNATEFVAPLTFSTLSKQPVITDMFKDQEEGIVSHIYYGQEYDLVIVAPATANIIGKTANGIADDMATSTLIAATKPVIFVPAMNSEMYRNSIVKENIRKLIDHGYHFVTPDIGALACGTSGIGKYPPNEKIIAVAEDIINTDS